LQRQAKTKLEADDSAVLQSSQLIKQFTEWLLQPAVINVRSIDMTVTIHAGDSDNPRLINQGVACSDGHVFDTTELVVPYRIVKRPLCNRKIECALNLEMRRRVVVFLFGI
jgi:hypothetical protein